jgi:hypothetical protein
MKLKKDVRMLKKLRIEIEDEIDKQSAESDNGFLMRIKAEINKLVINADPDVIYNIQAEIDSNLTVLQTAKTKIDECEMLF